MGGYISKAPLYLCPQHELSISIFPPPATFETKRDIPDLTGKVIIVIGGNTGIGFETIQQLLLKNATVYLLARSEDKAMKAVSELESLTKKKANFIKLDLGDLDSVKKAAAEFLAREKQLDVLYNNAGVMACPIDWFTAQNYDMQFGTNVLGPYLLTKLLVPALKKSQASHGAPARIVFISSSGHKLAPKEGIAFESLKKGEEREKWIKEKGGRWPTMSMYGQSKLGDLLLANHFATEYQGQIVSCGAHPGMIQSDLYRHVPRWLVSIILKPVWTGALPQLWGGQVAKPNLVNGEYLIPFGRVGPSSQISHDMNLCKGMVKWSDEEVEGYKA